MGGPSIYTPREPPAAGAQGSPVAATTIFNAVTTNQAAPATAQLSLYNCQGVRLDILEVATGTMTGKLEVFFRRPGDTTWESVASFVHPFTAEVVGGAPELNNIRTVEVMNLTNLGHLELGCVISGLTNGAVTLNASPF